MADLTAPHLGFRDPHHTVAMSCSRPREHPVEFTAASSLVDQNFVPSSNCVQIGTTSSLSPRLMTHAFHTVRLPILDSHSSMAASAHPYLWPRCLRPRIHCSYACAASRP